ncbi:MAG: hypothetical protein MMC23_006020 [Stictis urceolatum]|nr:hypothetical protein [Stictis urceolata]
MATDTPGSSQQGQETQASRVKRVGKQLKLKDTYPNVPDADTSKIYFITCGACEKVNKVDPPIDISAPGAHEQNCEDVDHGTSPFNMIVGNKDTPGRNSKCLNRVKENVESPEDQSLVTAMKECRQKLTTVKALKVKSEDIE